MGEEFWLSPNLRGSGGEGQGERKLEGVSEGPVEIGDLGWREGTGKMGELGFAEPENFPIDWSTDDSRYVFMFGNEGSGDHHIETRLVTTLGEALAGAVDLAALHGRACSAIRRRAWRASRFRCLCKTSCSCSSISRCRSRSENSRTAIRTRAERLRSWGKTVVNSSRSFSVVSSMVIVIVFMLKIIWQL